jgi:photosystem II stability/assembly factor-like uncharacterized protein
MNIAKSILIFLLILNINWVHANTWKLVTDSDLSINQVSINGNNPKIIYISTDEVLYKTKDAGDNFEFIDIGKLANESIIKIIISKQTTSVVYVITKQSIDNSIPKGFIYKTTDDGNSWEKLPHDFGVDIVDFKVNPHNQNILYAAVSSGRNSFYKSIDAGNSWKSISISNITTSIGSIAVNPQNPDILYVNTFQTPFTGTTSGIFESLDQGETWMQKKVTFNSPNSINKTQLPLAVNPHDTTIMYAGELRGFGQTQIEFKKELAATILKTTDGGETWQDVNHNSFEESYEFSVESIAINPHAPQIVYLGTTKGLYRTINGGEQWHLLSNSIDGQEPHITSVAVDPHHTDNIYLGTINNGLYRLSTDTHCKANYDISTKQVTIPCLEVDHTLPLYEVELKPYGEQLLFEVSNIQRK